jgi:hypothetical protein
MSEPIHQKRIRVATPSDFRTTKRFRSERLSRDHLALSLTDETVIERL